MCVLFCSNARCRGVAAVVVVPLFLRVLLTNTHTKQVRLTTVCVNTQYLVHSIVVAIDLFIFSISHCHRVAKIAACVPAVLFAIVYSQRKLVVFEIMETTALAIVATVAESYQHMRLHRSGHVFEHKSFRRRLLEDLLDGSSGVLYTSFFGLVLVECLELFELGGDTLYCEVW